MAFLEDSLPCLLLRNNSIIHGVEGALGGADEQTEHQRGECGDHAGAEFDDVLRFLTEMVAGQELLQTQTEQGACEDASYTHESDDYCIHVSVCTPRCVGVLSRSVHEHDMGVCGLVITTAPPGDCAALPYPILRRLSSTSAMCAALHSGPDAEGP